MSAIILFNNILLFCASVSGICSCFIVSSWAAYIKAWSTRTRQIGRTRAVVKQTGTSLSYCWEKLLTSLWTFSMAIISANWSFVNNYRYHHNCYSHYNKVSLYRLIINAISLLVLSLLLSSFIHSKLISVGDNMLTIADIIIIILSK